MKREIKFRGQSVNNGEWVYGDLLHRFGLTEIYQASGTMPVIPETIGQFTGLKDKNGVEIYEGDILYDKYDDELEDNGYGEIYYEVVFKDGAFGVMTEIADLFLPFSHNPRTTEVVAGNIHDYPEMLELLK